MKTTTRLLLIACLSLPVLAACTKEAEKVEVVETALVAPTGTDEDSWNTYLTEVVKRNLDGASNTYVYVLPHEGAADFQGYYDRQLEKAQVDIQRGIIEGNLLAYGSPSSAKTADLVIASFAKADPGSMKGVKVLFIGSAADNERVKAAVTPAGVDYKFFEVK